MQHMISPCNRKVQPQKQEECDEDRKQTQGKYSRDENVDNNRHNKEGQVVENNINKQVCVL